MVRSRRVLSAGLFRDVNAGQRLKNPVLPDNSNRYTLYIPEGTDVC